VNIYEKKVYYIYINIYIYKIDILTL